MSTSEDVIDVSFADEATGYALDAAGTLLRTDNSGQSWQILNTGTASRPQAVLALGTQTVLLVGPKGVLRSTDGGDTFTRIRGRLLSRSKLFNVDRGGRSVFVYGSKNILVSTTAGRTWHKVRMPRKTLIQAVDFVSAAYRLRARPGRPGLQDEDARRPLARPVRRGQRRCDRPVVLDDRGGLPHAQAVRVRSPGATCCARPTEAAPGARSSSARTSPPRTGSWQPGPSGAFLLADSRALLFTTSGGEHGDPSKVTLRTSRRTVRRRAVIRITGRVSGAKGGASVVISRRERGERGWVSLTATVASNGTFSTNWKLVKTAAFVAQWAGDENSAGDGSVPLVVRTKRR